MNNYKVLAWILAVMTSKTLAYTQENDPKAKKLLDEVYQKISAFDNLSVTFEYTLDNYEEDIHQVMEGNAIMKKEYYKFSFSGVTKMFDGKNVYTISPDNQEISILSKNEYDEEESNLTPSKMLTFYKEGYTYKWDILRKRGPKSIQYILLNPIKPESGIKKLLLGIDTSTKTIDEIIQIGADGTKITIRIKSAKFNQVLPPDTFIFNQKYYEKQGYYIMKD